MAPGNSLRPLRVCLEPDPQPQASTHQLWLPPPRMCGGGLRGGVKSPADENNKIIFKTIVLGLILEPPSSRLFLIFLIWEQGKPSFKSLSGLFASHHALNSLYLARQQQVRVLFLWVVSILARGGFIGSLLAGSTWEAPGRRSSLGAWGLWETASIPPTPGGCGNCLQRGHWGAPVLLVVFCLFVFFSFSTYFMPDWTGLRTFLQVSLPAACSL